MRKVAQKSKLKVKAWGIFSKYIRLKYADAEGMVDCYTCNNERKHWTKMQAGHGIGGRTNAVLFLEDIVKPQGVGCNMFANGRYAVFTRKLIEELGLERYDEIVKLSNTITKFTPDDYIRIYEEYKAKFEALTSNEDRF